MEFVRLAREIPFVVFPAFRLQETLRHYTLGESSWRKVNKRLLHKKKNAKEDAEKAELESRKEKERYWSSQIIEWESKNKQTEKAKEE